MKYMDPNDFCIDAIQRRMPPRPWSAASRRWLANSSSAIRPTRNGESMAPRAVVPAARPISWPEKCNCCPSQVPSVTYQAPQIKYSRNIITDKRNRICKITRSPLGKATHTRIRTKTSRSTRGGLAARGTIEPKIDGLFHARRRLIRHRDLAAFAGGGIARVERLHHNETVFSGGLRSFFAARATREVRQFFRRAVIPELFEYGVGPTFCGRRFFDGVAVAVFAECGQRVAHVQIGVGYAGFAEDFDAIVHTAAARPTVFDEAYGAVGEFEDAERIVFGFGFVVVNVGTHLTVDGLNWRTSEEPIAKGDAVTAEVHQRAAAGTIHIPEPGAVRTKVLFALLDEIDLSECAGVRHFLGFQIFWGEEKLFAVHQ